jgi:hypothetical protein
MTHPGVGPVTSLAFVLTIGPVSRFQRSRQLVSYLGLNPQEHSSGGRQHLGSISKQGNPMMRWLLVEAGHTAARYDPQLQRMYQRLKFRRGAGVAKVAIARKLAVRMYWMLRSPADYAQLAGGPLKPLFGLSGAVRLDRVSRALFPGGCWRGGPRGLSLASRRQDRQAPKDSQFGAGSERVPFLLDPHLPLR